MYSNFEFPAARRPIHQNKTKSVEKLFFNFGGHSSLKVNKLAFNFFKAWQSRKMAFSGHFVAFVVVSSVILFMVTLYVIGSIRLRFSKRLPQKYKLGRGRHAGICCTGCGGLRSRYKSTNPYRNSHKRYWRTMASKTT